MKKSFDFVSNGMIVHADRVTRGTVEGMVHLYYDGMRVGVIRMDLVRLRVLHFYKDEDYIILAYVVESKEGRL